MLRVSARMVPLSDQNYEVIELNLIVLIDVNTEHVPKDVVKVRLAAFS